MFLSNKITLIRILCIPIFVMFLLYYSPDKDYIRYIALIVFMLAIITDALDGFIARFKNQRSELGSYLDPIADKLLLLVAFISLSLIDNMPPHLILPDWVTVVVVARDGIILLGSGMIYIFKGKLKIVPSFLGKTTTFLQMCVILTLLAGIPFWKYIMYLAVGFTVLSGADYIRRGNSILNNL